jgi:hypothetical protein
MRIDVENLLQHEPLANGVAAIYQIDAKNVCVAISNSKGELVSRIENDRIEIPRAKISNWQLRIMICCGIIKLAPPPKPELIPIEEIDFILEDNLMGLDLPYGAILVSPDTNTEFEISKRPRMTNVFVSPIVPDGIIYGLANPEFLGVTTHWQDGDNGMLITNAKGITSIIVTPAIQVKRGRKENIENWMMLSEIMES